MFNFDFGLFIMKYFVAAFLWTVLIVFWRESRAEEFFEQYIPPITKAEWFHIGQTKANLKVYMKRKGIVYSSKEQSLSLSLLVDARQVKGSIHPFTEQHYVLYCANKLSALFGTVQYDQGMQPYEWKTVDEPVMGVIKAGTMMDAICQKVPQKAGKQI